MSTPRKRWKYTTVRQWGGDDGYQWSIFIKGERLPRVCGLTRPEVSYYREKFEREQEEKEKAKLDNIVHLASKYRQKAAEARRRRIERN